MAIAARAIASAVRWGGRFSARSSALACPAAMKGTGGQGVTATRLSSPR